MQAVRFSKMASRRRTTAKSSTERQREDELDELLVFGYQCKLFRDDEKAQFIDQGRHLLPWMNDERLKIDRFDGRGHLYDLKPYDADFVGGQYSTLTLEEQRVEQLCDEERYLELHSDVMEKAVYEEEELKRLNEALQDNTYSAMGFSYENQPQPQQQPVNHVHHTRQPLEPEKSESDEEQEYVVPKELKLPVGVKAPTSTKVNAIIEKTATFLAQHGPQMEIVIKTKQSRNPQFRFLDFEHELNQYYKHMVKMIKTGRYKPKPPEKPAKKEESSDESDEDDNNSSGYLHPSLMTNAVSNYQDDVLSTIQHRLPKAQINNTPYGRLINNLSKHTGRDSPTTAHPAYNSIHLGSSSVIRPPQTYRHAAPTTVTTVHAVSTHGHTHVQQAQEQVYTPNPGDLPPPPGMEPVTLPHAGEVSPTGTQSPVYAAYHNQEHPQDQNGSGIIPPPPDIQPVIDRMADYVAKNGTDFETIVRKRGDPRFDFLLAENIHNTYYEYKKSLFIKELNLEEEDNKSSLPKAVSFSIKAKENETGGLEKRSAFRHEDSDDGSDGEGSDKKERSSEQPGESSDSQMSTTFTEPRSYDERPERTPMSTEELERRQAEDRLKDRLAAAAREKLAQTSKEKQLQAERKRKAAMFLTMLKGTAPDKADASATDNGGDSSKSCTSPSASPHHSRHSSPHDRGSRSVRDRSPSHRSPHRSPSRRSPSSHRAKSPARNSTVKSSKRRSRSRSPRHRRHRRSRSRSPRRKRSKTPPSAYTFVRRSRSKSPSTSRRKARSSSRSRRSTSRSRRSGSKGRRSRSRSKSRRGGSKSKKSRSKRSKSRSRSRSKAKSHKKSRSQSPSKKKSKRSRSKSRSPSKKSSSLKSLKAGGSVPANLCTLASIMEVKTPKKPASTEVNQDRLIPEVQETQVTDATSKNGSSLNTADNSQDGKPSEKAENTETTETKVNSDLVKKVRAMLKGLRQEIRKEDL